MLAGEGWHTAFGVEATRAAQGEKFFLLSSDPYYSAVVDSWDMPLCAGNFFYRIDAQLFSDEVNIGTAVEPCTCATNV